MEEGGEEGWGGWRRRRRKLLPVEFLDSTGRKRIFPKERIRPTVLITLSTSSSVIPPPLIASFVLSSVDLPSPLLSSLPTRASKEWKEEEETILCLPGGGMKGMRGKNIACVSVR